MGTTGKGTKRPRRRERPLAPDQPRGGPADRGDQGQPQRGARPLPAASDVPARAPGVGSLRLKLDQVDTESRVLHVARLKRGLSTTHPLRGDELRAIGAWLKSAPGCSRPARPFL